YPLKKMIKLAKDGIYSFSYKPIKLAGGLGLLMLIAGLLWLVIAAIARAAGPVTIIVSCMLMIAGVVLVCMGQLGEYVGRIMEEVKGRPKYLVRRGPDDFKVGNKN
nr:glycosyltransferase [bacterium]